MRGLIGFFLGAGLLAFVGCAGDEFTSGSGGAAGGTSCPAGEKPCGTACVSVALPEFGCASPKCEACTFDSASAVCVDGACSLGTCLGGFGDCNGNPEDGCETNLNTGQNCGTCGKPCEPTQVCSASVCASGCSGTEVVCNGGCVDLQSDTANCGMCGRLCAPPLPANATNAQCNGGQCRYDCQPGWGDCEPSNPDCETNINDDNLNCGGCGVACPIAPDGAQSQECIAGACSCDGGRAACTVKGTGACVDVQKTPYACGSCQTACGHGSWCDGGTCKNPPACAFGLQVCGSGACVSTESDPQHCGGCNQPCQVGEVCKQGSCQAATNCDPTGSAYLLCGTNSCPHELLDAANCGACNNLCPSGETCVAGVCMGLELANEPWMCTVFNQKACLVPQQWPVKPSTAPYFCADACPWGQAP